MAYVLNLDKLDKNDLDKINDLVTLLEIKNAKELYKYLIENDLLTKISSREFKLPQISFSPIKTFLRGGIDCAPLIAGSSLKGAIRSVLFNQMREKEDNIRAVLGDLGDKDSNPDFMRFIQVGDIHMEDKTQLFNTVVFNLQKIQDMWQGGWKHAFKETDSGFKSGGFNTIYECLAPRQSGEGTLVFQNDLFEKECERKREQFTYPEKQQQLLDSGVVRLFEMINNATSEFLKKEHEFFTHFNQAQRTGEIIEHIECLQNLHADLKSQGACLLRMSAGSGFHSITGDVEEWKYPYNVKYINWKYKVPYNKSRKIVENGTKLQLMGFVKLELVKE